MKTRFSPWLFGFGQPAKLRLALLAGICLVIGYGLLVIGAGGCGQQATQEVTPTPTVTTVTISGKLYSGTIRTSAVETTAAGIRILASADSALANYSVVAVGTNDKKIYFPTTKTATSDGAFSISVPSGESFYLEILDDKFKFVAPIAFGATEGKVIMAVTPETEVKIELGRIAYESGKSTAVPTLEPTAFLDKNSKARPKSGQTLVPVGAGNLGKGEIARLTGTGEAGKIDGDTDGLPNVVDADNDGNGKIDDLEGSGGDDAVIFGSKKINSVNVFMNLKIPYEKSNNISLETDTIVTFHISPKSQYASQAEFSEVKVIDGPAYLDNATVVAGYEISDYPQNQPTFGSTGKKLYWDSQAKGFQVWLRPNVILATGEVYVIEVTYPDGDKEKFTKMINFVFYNIPRLLQYKTPGSDWTAAPPLSDPTIALAGNTTEVSLRWTRPSEETGSEIKYTWYNFYIEGYALADRTQRIFSGYSTPAQGWTDTGVGSYLEVDPYILPSFNTTATQEIKSWKVDITSNFPSGSGNAAQMIYYFKKP